jgi:drug/metabolite transporter (DMT)-like permease
MRFAGELAAVGTAVCWATGSNLFAAAGRHMSSTVLNRLRLTLALLFLAGLLWIMDGTPWPWWADAAQVQVLALSGVIGFVLGDAFFFRSLVILGPGQTTLLASTAPFFTAAIGWPVLGEVPKPLGWVGMLVTVSGLAWVLRSRRESKSVHVEGSVAVGVACGVLAALGQACGYVLSKTALQTGIDPLSATVVRVGAATASVWVLAAVAGSLGSTFAALHHRPAALWVIGGALCGPVLGVTLSLTALKFVDASVAASITASYPVLTIFIASRFNGEPLTTNSLLGALVAVSGVVILFLR